jgi:hypothetical protein
MDRARLKEFRQVRWGAVRLHWTSKDMAEYQEWLGGRYRGALDSGAEWLVVLAIILVLTAITIPVVYHIRDAAQRAAEFNAQQAQRVDRSQ